MRKVIEIMLLAVAVAAFVVGVVYAVRLVSNVSTPISLHTPKPSVTCATMVTGDGAAISCWKG